MVPIYSVQSWLALRCAPADAARHFFPRESAAKAARGAAGTEYRAPQEAVKSRALPAGEAGDRNLPPGRAACVGGTGPEATYARALNWTVNALEHGRRPPIWTCWRAAMREQAGDICIQLSGRAYVGACVCAYTSQQDVRAQAMAEKCRPHALQRGCMLDRKVYEPSSPGHEIAFESPIPIGSI